MRCFVLCATVVLPSPSVSALIKDGDLKISWEIPGRDEIKASWYDLQLDMGDQVDQKTSVSDFYGVLWKLRISWCFLSKQGNVKNLTEKLSYTEPNVDPSITYRLRMRTKISELYAWNSQWSEWSPIFSECSSDPTASSTQLYQYMQKWCICGFTALEKTNPLNPLVILGILLVIPMILLAVLLLVRHQRYVAGYQLVHFEPLMLSCCSDDVWTLLCLLNVTKKKNSHQPQL